MRDRARCCAYLIAGAVAGCRTPYLDASRQFATSTAASVAAFDGVFDLASSLCQRRARYAYLLFSLNRAPAVGEDQRAQCLPKTPDAPADPVVWTDYYRSHCLPVPGPDGSAGKRCQTWSGHCEEIAKADEIVGTALAALGSYADALARIAVVDYSGTDASALIKRSSTLIRALPAKGSRIADIARGLGDPVGTLAGALEHQYAEHHVAELVLVAAPSVSGIIASLQRYQSALILEEEDAEGYLDELSERFEDRIGGTEKSAPGGLLDPLLLADIELRWEAELQSNLHLLTAVGDGLQVLERTAQAMRQAAASPDPDGSAALKTVVSGSAIIAHDVSALVIAVRGQGG